VGYLQNFHWFTTESTARKLLVFVILKNINKLLMKYSVSCLIALIVGFFHFPLLAQNFPDKYVLVDGHKMHYQTGGSGETTVVFENGHGSTLNAWDDIFADVSKFSKVVRYDRLGYGTSEATTEPRSLKQIATELHKMLRAANLRPPYILAGHSMGGATIRAFAYLYKDETAGLVFVDPFCETEANGMTQKELQGELARADSNMKKAPPVVLAEFRILSNELTKGFPEINSFGPIPDMPIALVVAGKNRPPGWEKNLVDFYQSKMQTLSDSRMIVIPQSPHYIQAYDPLTVIESIRRVMFPDAENLLRKTLRKKGIDSCIALYKKIKATYPNDLIREKLLNTLGYEELSSNIPAAIALFSLNVAMYPDSYNTYDSLGEAYMNGGNKTEAIKNYEKSLKLNPANTNAEKMLKKLKAN